MNNYQKTNSLIFSAFEKKKTKKLSAFIFSLGAGGRFLYLIDYQINRKFKKSKKQPFRLRSEIKKYSKSSFLVFKSPKDSLIYIIFVPYSILNKGGGGNSPFPLLISFT